MDKLLEYNNKLFELLGKISDIIILNFLFIIFSLPIFTIGASTTALYYVSLKIINNEEPYIFKTFIKSFKENLKISTVLWLIFMFVGGILILDFYISNQLENEFIITILKFIFTIISIIYVFGLTYVFPIISKFDNTIKNTIINSILISIQNLPYTILIIIINVLPFILITIMPNSWGYVLFFYISIGIGITTVVNSIFFDKIFVKYISE